ncbi:MAG: cation:proton antiporter [Acidobacteriota bacterium]
MPWQGNGLFAQTTPTSDQATESADDPAGDAHAGDDHADDAHADDAHADGDHATEGHGDDHEEGDHGGGHGGGHADPFIPILLGLAWIVLAALAGRHIATRFGQPSVLGELLFGVLLGNLLYFAGFPLGVLVMHLDAVTDITQEIWHTDTSVNTAAATVFTAEELEEGGPGARVLEVMTAPDGWRWVFLALGAWIFSNLGVILLLFMVGLESDIDEMKQVGVSSLGVAILGIIVPYGLGYGFSAWLLPDKPETVHIFIAATLCATSVGITARVFKDLRKLHTDEARVILGAAVIDDVLGLIILAVVVGIVATGSIDMMEVGRISLLSLIFLGGVAVLGDKIARLTARIVGSLDRYHGKLLMPLCLAFLMSWAANQIELASIVGAFAAGLILDDDYFREAFGDNKPPVPKEDESGHGHGEHETDVSIYELVAPLEAIFAPVFFVLMGMQVNLATFGEIQTLGLAAALTGAAIVGKLIAGLPAKGLDRLSIGLGMVPRGEVGLIFASVGKGLGVVTDSVFSAVVIMVIVTTLITPIGLKWSLARAEARQTAAG